MSTRFSRLTTRVAVVAAVVLIAGTSWAIFDDLGPSQDEWKLKYEVGVNAASADMLTVAFTLADEGRLKPVYSITLIAFSAPDRSGARSYDAKVKIDLKPTEDGKRAGQAQIRKDLADRAIIRVLTQTVDGRRLTTGASAAFYDIPLKRFLNRAPAAASRPKAPSPK